MQKQAVMQILDTIGFINEDPIYLWNIREEEINLSK